MCTVSFYKDKNKTIITSNRDEHISRPLALPPEMHIFNGKKLYFPKDPAYGGSWFVVNEIGSVFVLLNGADKKHEPDYPYRKSRGLILLEIASASNIANTWHTINLERIEPFTTVAYGADTLYQLRWNGTIKTMVEMDIHQPRIWSSATLYTHEIIAKRETWFSDYLEQSKGMLSASELVKFHTGTQLHDTQNGLIINRGETLLTKNVTQFTCVNNMQIGLLHLDLILNHKTELIISE